MHDWDQTASVLAMIHNVNATTGCQRSPIAFHPLRRARRDSEPTPPPTDEERAMLKELFPLK